MKALIILATVIGFSQLAMANKADCNNKMGGTIHSSSVKVATIKPAATTTNVGNSAER